MMTDEERDEAAMRIMWACMKRLAENGASKFPEDSKRAKGLIQEARYRAERGEYPAGCSILNGRA